MLSIFFVVHPSVTLPMNRPLLTIKEWETAATHHQHLTKVLSNSFLEATYELEQTLLEIILGYLRDKKLGFSMNKRKRIILESQDDTPRVVLPRTSSSSSTNSSFFNEDEHV